ncbi:hypothetical protein SAMN05216559_4152 [Halomicrobium zhouii]|uniref:Uncharacterized protein n=1 Tax=Halomicrobium zhouii TaxID=767519 RepID=A0A1I6MAZ5_9EURY|nr:DUF5810 domain-containing protein [Halomicrobium zhouii]SFS12890.1 hypothetical protein SAMN05216559_4152 [Halomicrobium zhouii]
MGYACPVCEDPQSDAGHLANHLAFTAITTGGDHEEWLDEHVPGWGQLGEAELAEEVADHAEETEFPQVFEESGLEDSHDHPHGHGGHQHGGGAQGLDDHGLDPSAARSRGAGDLDEEAQKIMAEARELTEEIRDGDEDAVDEGTSDDGGSSDDESDEADESGENAEADAEGESEGETE